MPSPDQFMTRNGKTLLSALTELNSFEGSPSEFLNKLIYTKRLACEAAGAALVKIREDGGVSLVTSSPPFQKGIAPTWLTVTMAHPEEILSVEGVFCKLFEELDNGLKAYMVFVPLKPGDPEHGTEVYHLVVRDILDLNRRLQRLQILLPYYSFYEGRLQLKEFKAKTSRLYQAFDVMIKLNASETFHGSLMSMCNEFSSRWLCSRVSFGVVSGRNATLKALSNSEKFNRKVAVIRDLESVMEECSDQNIEVPFPQKGDGVYVCRRAQKFSDNHGPIAVLSLPVRMKDNVFGVVTFERSLDHPFEQNEIEVLRLTLDLLSPRLDNLQHKDRWFGALVLDGIKSAGKWLVGASYTLTKLLILSCITTAIFFNWHESTYQVESTFSFDAKNTFVVSAPFSGEISKIFVENGQKVKSGQELFRLDTTELDLELNSLEAQRLQALKQAAVSLREGKPAEEHIARANAASLKAEIDLTKYSLAASSVKAKMAGTIVGDELKKLQFSVVELGKTIIEIVSTDSLEATLFVPEDQIADVAVNQKGELAAAGYPDRKIVFDVIAIERVARVVGQKNVYRIRAAIDNNKQNQWMHAGMEGVARIDIEDRLTIWIWTRKAINWIRMKLWF